MENLVDVVKAKLKEPIYLAIAAVIAGLILGLVIGWGVWPVQWTDASAENLRPDLRLDYLKYAIATFTLTGDQVKAVQSFAELGKNAESTLAELNAAPGFLNTEQISRFAAAVQAPIVTSIPDQTQTSGSAGIEATPTGASGKSNGLLTLGLVLLAALIIGAGLVYYFFFRNKLDTGQPNLTDSPVGRPMVQYPEKQAPAAVPMRQAPQMAQPVRSTAAETVNPVMSVPMAVKNTKPSPLPPAKPIAQFMTTYMFGDDLYDESFTFDAPNGEFLGECGVSISDLIGVGEPKKISAFEVWLFDKNDVQTVTKVLMSEHTFTDPAMRQRLELKGEPLLVEPGKQFTLETATLRLEAHIVDVSYGDLPLPVKSYFQRSTIELAVYRK